MKLNYRAVWLSDIHLGSRACRAEELAHFLKHLRCQKLYLVGDIIDMELLRSRWHWPAKHNDVVRRILKMAKHTRVVYVPGNHDDAVRSYASLSFGGVHVRKDAVHTTVDGRRLLVLHGDQFDLIVRHSPWLCRIGSRAYDALVVLNRFYNTLRAAVGLPYTSLSQSIKQKVKTACTFISHFEEAMMHEAQKRQMDGVVCGHIHKAEIRMEAVQYFNCGDWVEGGTALVEHYDGRMEIIDGIAAMKALDAHKDFQKQMQKELSPLPVPTADQVAKVA